jgi:hypothetical protein
VDKPDLQRSIESIRILRHILPPISAIAATTIALPLMYFDRGDPYVPFARSFLLALAMILCSVPLFYVLYRSRGVKSHRSIIATLFILIAFIPAAYVAFVPTCVMSFAMVSSAIGQDTHLMSGAIPYGIGFLIAFTVISESIYGSLFARQVRQSSDSKP